LWAAAVTASPYKKIKQEEMTENEEGIYARMAFISIEKCFSNRPKPVEVSPYSVG
jgi:hypothetical protein